MAPKVFEGLGRTRPTTLDSSVIDATRIERKVPYVPLIVGGALLVTGAMLPVNAEGQYQQLVATDAPQRLSPAQSRALAAQGSTIQTFGIVASVASVAAFGAAGLMYGLSGNRSNAPVSVWVVPGSAGIGFAGELP